MKVLFCAYLILLANLLFSQKRYVDFSDIDWKVQSINASSADSLAQKLTAPYTTDLQKVRSIFRWITNNIAYKVRSNSPRLNVKTYMPDENDTLSKSLNERVAAGVLKRRVAVCDGYARLFKTLCDDAGIKSEIITGYARGDRDRVGVNFRSNHNWNAVFIDSTWYLLDVTWASGYITYTSGDFVQHFDESYFLTPPQDFIRDHYPEDIRWTLLTNPPTLNEFYKTPFKHSGFVKNRILSYAPANGVVEATLGDTLHFELETEDDKKQLLVTDSIYYDSSTFSIAGRQPGNAVCRVSGKKVSYFYPVTSPSVEWLYVLYNNEAIMQYKLNIKKSDTAVK